VDLNFKNLIKSFWFWFIVSLVAIQFITFDVPAQLPTHSEDEIKAPKEVMHILKRSCYDCHSSSVTYPWYDKIAPVSWFVKTHIKNGRRVVNFSNWNNYSKERQLKIMEKLPKAIVIRMPMPSYLWLHPEANLSNEDKKILTQWAKNLEKSIK